MPFLRKSILCFVMHPMSTEETVFKTPGNQWYRKPGEKKRINHFAQERICGSGCVSKIPFSLPGCLNGKAGASIFNEPLCKSGRKSSRQFKGTRQFETPQGSNYVKWKLIITMGVLCNVIFWCRCVPFYSLSQPANEDLLEQFEWSKDGNV